MDDRFINEKKATNRIIEFTMPIIPQSWQIHPVWQLVDSYKRGYLYIKLIVIDKDYFLKEVDEYLANEDEYPPPRVGGVKGPMFFYPIRLFKKVSKGFPGRKSIIPKCNPNASFASVELMIVGNFMGWHTTIVHEYAHIAAMRVLARKKGIHEGILVEDFDEPMHGPLFQKAYRRMIIRTENAYGKDMVKVMKSELNIYKKEWKKEVTKQKK